MRQKTSSNLITTPLTTAVEADFKDESESDSDSNSLSCDSESESGDDTKSLSIESDGSSDESVVKDQNLAVKIVRSPDNEITEMAYDEFKLLKTLDHPNIVKMHDAFYNESKQTMFLVMDQIKGKSLSST